MRYMTSKWYMMSQECPRSEKTERAMLVWLMTLCAAFILFNGR